MATITDAVFFLKDGEVVKEMMMAEFDALLEGVFEIPEFKSKKITAVFVQINQHLQIKGLVFL